MTKRSLLLAAAVAALMSFGSAAQAAFTVNAQFTQLNGTAITPTTTLSPATGLTFTGNTITVLSDNLRVSYNFSDITYANSTRNVGPLTFTFAGILNVVNNGVTGSTNFSGSFTYTVNSVGEGSLVQNSLAINPLVVAGVTFDAPSFASPTITPTGTAGGNLSTYVRTAAVPEPASVAMVGLGLAGLGGLALRRRTAK